MVAAARLEDVGSGLAPVTPGWFVVNANDAAWVRNELFGWRCSFESNGRVLRSRPELAEQRFEQVGITLAVLEPGWPSGLYHAESAQEDFIVLAGECAALVDGEERALRVWDLVHCPPGTAHVFVGTSRRSVLLMTGARIEGRTIVYPRSAAALARGAGVEQETSSPTEAYARLPRWEPGRPEDEDELPWGRAPTRARVRLHVTPTPVPPLEASQYGLVPRDTGWFVLNAGDAPWWKRDGRGHLCEFEDPEGDASDFSQLGINVTVLAPGEPMAMYHWEADQEDFLVVSGEALAIVEGEEQPLRSWDLLHCPPHTEHTIVGAGKTPCVVVAVGARDRSTGPEWGGYPVDEVAQRHDAGVDVATAVPAEAYARFAKGALTAYPHGLLPD